MQMLATLKSRRYVLMVMFGAILVSFSPVFANLTVVGTTTSGFYRVLFGSIALIIMVILTRQPLPRSKAIWLLLLGSAAFFALDLMCWHCSVRYIGPGLSTILANFQVFILAAIGLIVYRERGNWKFYTSLPLALLGLSLLLLAGWYKLGQIYHVGVYFGLLSALFYALFILPLRRSQQTQESLSPLLAITITSVFASVFLAILVKMQHQSFIIPDMQNYVYLIAYGVLCQALGWLLICAGLPKLPISLAGFLLLLQPSLAFIWDMTIFHRQTPLVQILGAMITLVAIYLSTVGRQNEAT